MNLHILIFFIYLFPDRTDTRVYSLNQPLCSENRSNSISKCQHFKRANHMTTRERMFIARYLIFSIKRILYL